jgi:hypothetical protein
MLRPSTVEFVCRCNVRELQTPCIPGFCHLYGTKKRALEREETTEQSSYIEELLTFTTVAIEFSPE